MKKGSPGFYFYLLIIVPLCFPLLHGCQSPAVDISPEYFGRASLNVIWQPQSIQALPYNNPIPPTVRLYQSENDWLNNIHYLAHRDLVSGPLSPVSFGNLAPQNYWVKVFFINTADKLIEHNLNNNYLTPLQLQEHASYNMFIPTEIQRPTQYHLNAIQIHDLPFAKEYLRNNGSVIFRVRKISNYSQADTRIVYQENIRLDALPLTLSNVNIDMDIFDAIDPEGWSYYYVEVVQPDQPDKVLEFYHFDILGLLSTNMNLDGKLSYINAIEHMQYTFLGTFSFSN